jgi:hypothetical protein
MKKKKGQCGKQQIPESNGTQEFNLGAKMQPSAGEMGKSSGMLVLWVCVVP